MFDVNAHIHTPYSFSAFASVDEALDHAEAEGVKVVESVKKTGRIIIAGDATARGSYLNDLAANIADLCFDYLDAAPVVLGSRNWITPSHELEAAFFPQPSWFLDAINEKMLPLKDYVPVTNQTCAQSMIRSKKGI